MKESSNADELARDLQVQIKEGRYGTDGRIPRVSELATRWGVSRTTVYTVLNLLQSEGVLYAKDRSFYATPDAFVLEGLTYNFRQYLTARHVQSDERNLSDPEIVTLPSDIADLFQQPEGVKVLYRMRYQGTNLLSLRIVHGWYPLNLAGQYLEHMRTDDHFDALNTILDAIGVSKIDVEDSVIGRLPTSDEARWLRLVRTEPVVEIKRVSRTPAGMPVMFNKIVHRASVFKFTYKYTKDHRPS